MPNLGWLCSSSRRQVSAMPASWAQLAQCPTAYSREENFWRPHWKLHQKAIRTTFWLLGLVKSRY